MRVVVEGIRAGLLLLFEFPGFRRGNSSALGVIPGLVHEPGEVAVAAGALLSYGVAAEAVSERGEAKEGDFQHLS